MQKVFLIICDGLGDRPIKKLGNKTPLEAAKTPNLDKLASHGISGAMNTIDIGIKPGSDTAHLAIFGYDPNVYYTGRGPFETSGINMDMKKGDVCFRVNMGSVDKNLKVLDRRAGRIDDTGEFAKLFDKTKIEDVTFYLKKGTAYRIGMIMRGKSISCKVTDADPQKIGLRIKEVEPKDDTDEAKKTARILNKFLTMAYRKLKKLPSNKQREKEGKFPANYFLVRGAGIYPDIPSFYDKYGLKAACIAGAGLYKGISKVVGMDILHAPGATGKPDSDIKSKVETALKNKSNYDFFFIHFKGTDTLGEDGDCIGKIKYIEKIDEAIIPLFKVKNAIVVITADHSTPCSLKSHSADDVPIIIKAPGLRVDDVHKFNERVCAKGRLGHIKGMHLMPIVIDLMGLAEKFGA